MESLHPPLLLIPSPRESLDVHVQIPRSGDNLFERLIRDPQAPHRPMRERQCAEMLRSVLVACPVLASFVFKWLAQLTGISNNLIDELEWSLETEQSIGSKRDDLRIEGWRTDSQDPRRAVLWTIEIKVAAPLHDSSRQDWEGISEVAPENDPEIVSQLVNYDEWLARQDAVHKAGFVLALRDMSTGLPEGLRQPWHCFTWTALGLEVEKALATDLLPISERPFAEHMLGFIRHRLWDTTDMTTSRLELDDVALLRALAAIGPSCSRKIKTFVNEFQKSFENLGVSFVDIGHTNGFFDRTENISYAIRARCVSGDGGEVSVSVGVVNDESCVWLGSYPKGCQAYHSAHKILQEHKSQLIERNVNWVINDSDDGGYLDVQIAKPLVSVLAVEDWQTPLSEFVDAALSDLVDLGILEAFTEIVVDKDES